MAPIQIDSSFRRREDPVPEHINGLGTNKNLVMVPKWARNQERLFWRGPATILCYAMLLSDGNSEMKEFWIAIATNF
jgi:hypothetical protein